MTKNFSEKFRSLFTFIALSGNVGDANPEDVDGCAPSAHAHANGNAEVMEARRRGCDCDAHRHDYARGYATSLHGHGDVRDDREARRE